MKQYIFFFFTVWFFSACSSIKVDVDYDTDFSFNHTKTFAVIHKAKAEENALVSDRIIAAIHSEMTSKHYEKTSAQTADLYIVFHTDVMNKSRIVQDYQYIGISPYRYRYGYSYRGMMAVPTTHTYHYDEGKLIVDILDAKQKKIVWRGVATDSLKQHDTPEERTVYINEVMHSLFKTLPVSVK